MRTRAHPLAELGVLKLGNSEMLSKEHDLLITEAQIAGHRAKCLIDSGATHNFVAERWVERVGITTSESDTQISLAVADGRRQLLNETVTPRLHFRIGGYSSWESLVVIPLEGYDVVLGKPWLTQTNPDIDFVNNLVTLSTNDGNRCHTVDCTSDQHRQADDNACPAEFMSIKHARRALRKGAECIIVKLEGSASDDSDGTT